MTYVFEITPFFICWLIGCVLIFPLFIPGNLKRFVKFIHRFTIVLGDRTLDVIVNRHDNIRRLTVGRKWLNKRYYRH